MQLKDDPYRRVVIENSVVRIWDAIVPVGESTPFHEHKLDTVNVRINSTEVTNIPKGGLFSFKKDFQLESGTVAYSEYSKSSYVHRLTPKGPNPHRVIEIELLSAPNGGPSKGIGDRLSFTQILDNSRIRATRLVLEPAQSTEFLAPAKNTAIVAIKEGTVSMEPATDNKPFKEIKPGDVQWFSDASRRTIKNVGLTRVELVEIEVK